MTTPSIEAVVAGSKGFALALLAPLTERIGTRPRVASDPSQALALCHGPSGLVVVEFMGEDSLRTIKDLVLQGEGLRIVAAVAETHAAAEEPLRALGVELARWDGKPGAVLAAVARQLVAAAIDGAPESPTSAAIPRTRPAASVNPPPIPVRTTPVARASSPARVSGTASAVLAAPPLPRATPTPAAPPPVPAAARPAEGPALAVTPALAVDHRGASADPAVDLFSDVAQQEDFDVDLADEPPSQLLAAPFASATVWPMNVPSTAEAAEALARGLSGLFDPPGTPFAGVADVVDSLSELERAVFAGEPQAVDCEPVRRAAVMRVRVGAALATAPAEGGAVDAGAVSAFLAEIDALLSDVNALAASAPAELQLALETVRNSLVKEAIDFSEASHRGAPAEQPAAAPVPTRAVRETRIVSMASEAETAIEAAQGKRQRSMYIVLAASMLVAASYHGYQYATRPLGPPPGVGMPGVPADAIVSIAREGGPQFPTTIVSPDGRPFARGDIATLADGEALKGNQVKEIGPGMIVILPPGGPQMTAPLPQPERQPNAEQKSQAQPQRSP